MKGAANTSYSDVNLEKYRTEEVSSISSERGVFSDGRPFVTECWAQDHITMLTFYFSPIGFKIDKRYKKGKSSEKDHKQFQDILEYLVTEKAIGDIPDPKHVSVLCFGNEDDRIVSVNIFIGIDDC